MNKFLSLFLTGILISGCTSQRKLAYLNNIPGNKDQESFIMDIPEYHIQPRDVLYITVKAMSVDGTIQDLLSPNISTGILAQADAGSAFLGYNVDPEGYIIIVPVGKIKVSGLTLEETRTLLQQETSKAYKNAIVECRLLSFKFTVFGEVKAPGVYLNYNNYLTVLEALGRAGGISDFGNRDNILVVRPTEEGTRTFRLNLHDKTILSSEGYFLLPNDLIIVEPLKQKVFNLNLPTVSFMVTAFTSALTTTLLLINFLK